MSMNYLTEAFKQMELLEGNSFSFNEEGAAKMASFLEDDVLDDFETVIDPEAETEEELQPTYVGKVILGCDTCHSMIYKDVDKIIVDEESQLANVGELCPYCFTTDGFKIIGKVAPFEEVTVEVEGNSDEVIKVDVDGQQAEKVEETLTESMEDISITTEEEVIKIKSTPREDKEEIKPLQPEEIAEIVEPEETVEESPEEVEEPVVEPVDDTDFEEIDEEGFDQLGENYLKKVYENVESFKTVTGKRVGAKIVLEGLIKFNSGKKAKTSFVFESKEITKRGKLRLIGENLNIAKNKGAFILTGRNTDKKFMCEAFTYNYSAKDAKSGECKKLYGTIRK